MSVSSGSAIEHGMVEARKHINKLISELARLSAQDLTPADYYSSFLHGVQTALTATAGAIWLFTPQNRLQLQFQSNMHQVGLDRSETSRQMHEELLRYATTKAQPIILMPQSGVEGSSNGAKVGNPTDYAVLLAPIMLDKQVAGLVEIWQDANRNHQAQKAFLQFLIVAADLATAYTRNLRLRHMSGQQQIWTQLEAFTRQIHATLDPTQVSYLVANEGRRLVDCDRLSVAQRHGQRTLVEAVSGSDVVEKRSNLVQLMNKLFDCVLTWNENLVYSGTRDDSLPPNVLSALDAYLAESNSKFLAVQPLRDPREKDSPRPARSALLMECFEPTLTPEQLVGRLEVVGRHSATALYNSLEHLRIPFRWLWLPIARLQEGLGGKTKATVYGVSALVVAILLAMIFIPYPLKMDAKGNLLPHERRWVYAPVEGKVERFEVQPGMDVLENQSLVLMRDYALGTKLIDLIQEKNSAGLTIGALNASYTQAPESERPKILSQLAEKQAIANKLMEQINHLRARTNSDESRPGYFWVKSPMNGTILNSDFRENFTDKFMRPSDQMLRVGDRNGSWEIKLKIPQKHIGQVLRAFGDDPNKLLDVDLSLASAPTYKFLGKLARDKIAGEASPNREDSSDAEPVVEAVVRIDGPDIDLSRQIPRNQFVTDTVVHANVRCGDHALGYSLFYGVWEFLYEKVIFFLF